jgi:hypothetical protein
MLRLLPRFLPGVSEPAREPDDLVPALPDGAVLRPSLPPPSGTARERSVDRRAMALARVKVGEAVLSLRVALEAEGVQIDVGHVEGGAARVRIAIPRPEEFEVAHEYVDWYRQDSKGVPHELALQPGDDPHTLYGRFEPRRPRWPTRVPARLPAQLEAGCLWLEIGDGDPDRGRFEKIAQCLAGSPLELCCALRSPFAAAGADSRSTWTEVRADFTDPGVRAQKLAWLCSSVERFVLGRRD